VRGSYQETARRNNAENTVKHRSGGVGLMVANHRDGGERLVVVTTLTFIAHHFQGIPSFSYLSLAKTISSP